MQSTYLDNLPIQFCRRQIGQPNVTLCFIVHHHFRMIDEFSLPKKELSEQFFVKNLVQLKNEFEKYLGLKVNEPQISILINIGDELTKRREFVDYFLRFYKFLNDNFEVEWYILDSGDSGYSILSNNGLPRKITSRKIKIETRKLVNINQLNNELYVFKK